MRQHSTGVLLQQRGMCCFSLAMALIVVSLLLLIPPTVVGSGCKNLPQEWKDSVKRIQEYFKEGSNTYKLEFKGMMGGDKTPITTIPKFSAKVTFNRNNRDMYNFSIYSGTMLKLKDAEYIAKNKTKDYYNNNVITFTIPKQQAEQAVQPDAAEKGAEKKDAAAAGEAAKNTETPTGAETKVSETAKGAETKIEGEQADPPAPAPQPDVIVLESIAAMAPTNEGIPDFWQLIWDHDITDIAMLTTLTSKNSSGRESTKSARYWDEKVGKWWSLGNNSKLDVKVEKAARHSLLPAHNFGTIRTIAVRDRTKGDASIKRVTQYHFEKWPDHGIPSMDVFIEYMKLIEGIRKEEKRKLLVHCSHGSGRTGTLIMEEVLFNYVRENILVGPEEIYAAIETARTMRPEIVDTEEQFKFIGDVLVHVIEKGKVCPKPKPVAAAAAAATTSPNKDAVKS